MKTEYEKVVSSQVMKFLDFMESAHGFIPYGFYNDVKSFMLESHEALSKFSALFPEEKRE